MYEIAFSLIWFIDLLATTHWGTMFTGFLMLLCGAIYMREMT